MGLFSTVRRMKVLSVALAVDSLSLAFAFVLAFANPWPGTLGAGVVHGAVPDSDGADFSQSVMLGPDHKIREGDTIDYEIILRNTGSERPKSVELWNAVDSPGAMLALAPELSYDLNHRVLRWHGTVDRGEERRFTVRLVTLPGSAGTIVSNYASIVWDGKTKGIQSDLEVRSKEGNAKILFTVGRIGLGWLEVMILGYLLFAPLFLIAIPPLIRWRERQRFERSPDVSTGERHGRDYAKHYSGRA